MVNTPRKIGLVHHTSGGNLGDDGTLAAVIYKVKMRWPDAEIVGLGLDREDSIRSLIWPLSHKEAHPSEPPADTPTSLKDKIKATVINNDSLFRLLKAIYTVAIGLQEIPFLVKSFRNLRSIDLLIVNAGGQLAEPAGRPRAFRECGWKFSYTIFRWTLLARLASIESMILNLAVGPLGGLSKMFLKRALSLAKYVSLRDEQSSTIIHDLGFTCATRVHPDSAYGLEVSREMHARISNKDSRIGFAPIFFGQPTPPSKDEDPRFTSFLQQVGSFGAWLIRNNREVALFCTDINIDPPALCRLNATIRTDVDTTICDKSIDRVHQWSTAELLANMSSMDYVITSRFHGVVFAHMLGIPVLAISNHPTVSELMSDLGLSDFCIDISKCDANLLVDRFISLVSHRDEIKSQMATKLTSYRAEISNQFDELFPSEMSSSKTINNGSIRPLIRSGELYVGKQY
jgi:polysaccharide pyruvyl transferase WcaK-like protein